MKVKTVRKTLWLCGICGLLGIIALAASYYHRNEGRLWWHSQGNVQWVGVALNKPYYRSWSLRLADGKLKYHHTDIYKHLILGNTNFRGNLPNP